MTQSRLFFFALVILIFLAFLGRALYPHLDAWLGDASVHTIILISDPTCDPALQICAVDYGDLTIALRLEEEIEPLVPFSMRLWLRGADDAAVDRVSMRFAMVGMDMGISRFELEPQNDELWYGKALLPICTHGRRDWLIQLEMTGDKSYRAAFHTVVDKGTSPK